MRKTNGHGLQAYMNHGRWLYHCPRCGAALPVEKNVCPVCNPAALARMLQRVRGERYRTVPDNDARQLARALAERRGELLQPVMPVNREQIERVLRPRRLENMNWEPGETLEYLIEENRAHGVEVPSGL